MFIQRICSGEFRGEERTEQSFDGGGTPNEEVVARRRPVEFRRGQEMGEHCKMCPEYEMAHA